VNSARVPLRLADVLAHPRCRTDAVEIDALLAGESPCGKCLAGARPADEERRAALDANSLVVPEKPSFGLLLLGTDKYLTGQ